MRSIILIVSLFIFPIVASGQETSGVRKSYIDSSVLMQQIEYDTSAYLSQKVIFGAAYGTPGILNLVFGYNWSSYGVRVSGGGMFLLFGTEGLRGIQANLSYVLYRKRNFMIDISAVGMNSTDRTGTFQAIGMTCSMNSGGFFLELGYPYRLDKNNTQSDMRPLFQIGYVH
jgi:hypothetical protein